MHAVKNTLLAAGLLLVLASCGVQTTPAYKRQIPPERIERAACCIEAVAAASNPKSDEEPEDMLAQIEAMALDLFGEPVPGAWVAPAGGMGVFVPYEDAPPLLRAEILDELRLKGMVWR